MANQFLERYTDMGLTRLITERMKEGPGPYFTALIDDYGAWADYTGAPGLKTGTRKPGPRFIDDESALIIDRFFGEIKRKKPKVYKIMFLYYIKKMDVDRIAGIVRLDHPGQRMRKKQKRKGKDGAYSANHIAGTAQAGIELGPADVEFIIRRATLQIYHLIEDLKNEGL